MVAMSSNGLVTFSNTDQKVVAWQASANGSVVEAWSVVVPGYFIAFQAPSASSQFSVCRSQVSGQDVVVIISDVNQAGNVTISASAQGKVLWAYSHFSFVNYEIITSLCSSRFAYGGFWGDEKQTLIEFDLDSGNVKSSLVVNFILRDWTISDDGSQINALYDDIFGIFQCSSGGSCAVLSGISTNPLQQNWFVHPGVLGPFVPVAIFSSSLMYSAQQIYTLENRRSIQPGSVFALNPKDGTLMWSVVSTMQVAQCVAVPQGVLVLGSLYVNQGNQVAVQLFSAQNGTLVWTSVLPQGVGSFDPSFSNLAVEDSGRIHLHACEGDEIFVFFLPFFISSFAKAWRLLCLHSLCVMYWILRREKS